jgi:hypothetical protein
MRPLAATLLLTFALAACGGGERATDRTSLVAAGDIASCFWRGDESTARLLDHIGGIVAPLGDNAYPSGSDTDNQQCYHRTWGGVVGGWRGGVGLLE